MQTAAKYLMGPSVSTRANSTAWPTTSSSFCRNATVRHDDEDNDRGDGRHKKKSSKHSSGKKDKSDKHEKKSSKSREKDKEK